MYKFLLCSLFCLLSLTAKSIEITRYVAEGATGDGMTKETPAGDLKKILDLSSNVESLTVYLTPGTYVLPTVKGFGDIVKYNNVIIYGGGSAEVLDVSDKSVIKGDLFINGGAIVNVDFIGSVYEDPYSPNVTEGELHVIGCNVFYSKATKFFAEAVSGQEMWLVGLNMKDARISAYKNGMGTPQVYAWGCNFSNGLGASFRGVKLIATECKFNNNSGAVGLDLGVVDGSVIRNCEIIGNKGYGAMTISGLTDDINVVIDRCIISNNVTTDPRHCSVITTFTPFHMRNCLIANNYDMVEKDGIGYEGDHWRGAILLTRRQTLFTNCTFYNNGGALLHYKMEPGDHQRITSPQFSNCVFLRNKISYITKTGLKPNIAYSAADFGSDIPELDSEKHMIRITEANVGMVVENQNRTIRLLENSPLINVGQPMVSLDINGNSHQLLGGTDLGCCEYTGDWEKCQSETLLKIYGKDYPKIKTSYKGINYYGYIPNSEMENGKVKAFANSIYAGTEIIPAKKIGDGDILSYLKIGNKKYALINVLEYAKLPGAPYEIWVPQTIKEFTTTPPTAELVNSQWVLKDAKPKSATPSRKKKTTQHSRNNSRTSTSSRKR